MVFLIMLNGRWASYFFIASFVRATIARSHPRKQLQNPRSTSALKLPQSSHNIILFMNPLNLSSTLPSFKSLSFCDCDKQNAWEYKQKSHIECEEWKQVFINSKINSVWWFGPSVGRCTSYLFIYKCMHPTTYIGSAATYIVS